MLPEDGENVNEIIEQFDGEKYEDNSYIFPSNLHARKCLIRLQQAEITEFEFQQMQDVIYIKPKE